MRRQVPVAVRLAEREPRRRRAKRQHTAPAEGKRSAAPGGENRCFPPVPKGEGPGAPSLQSRDKGALRRSGVQPRQQRKPAEKSLSLQLFNTGEKEVLSAWLQAAMACTRSYASCASFCGALSSCGARSSTPATLSRNGEAHAGHCFELLPI